MLKKLRTLIFFLSILAIVALELAFITPQLNEIKVEGQAVYDTKAFSNLKVKVYITQDDKPYKTVYADSKGNFSASLDFNHVYMFHMSMDFHGTSKVLMDTKVPASVNSKEAGGFFEFKCQMFELYEGLHTNILQKPILKMRYYEDKNDFDFDKKYTESLSIDLEAFIARIHELKQRRKEVVKTEAQAKEIIANAPKQEKNRKVIEFKSEKEKPKAVNKRGHKNIMDFLNEDEEEVVDEEQEIAEAIVEEENEILDEKKKEKIAASEDKPAEELFLEEELDESEYTALNVIPKRVLIESDEIVTGPVLSEETQVFETQKMRVKEVQEIKRIEEEAKIRDVVNTYNRTQFVMRVKRMDNKKIQTDRLRNLIKTISLAEIYYKKAFYKKYPINHDEIIPSVVVHKNNSMWVDKESVMIRFPGESITFRKESYLFGITYYYKGDEKIDEETYCSNLNNLSKNNYECAI